MEPPRVCYVGITKPDFSRTGVQLGALRTAGVEVIECFDSSPGLRKFFRIYTLLKKAKGAYDVIIVGYPGAIMVPFVRLISSVPVIFDAGWTLFEGVVLGRGMYAKNPFARFFVWLLDRLAHDFAHLVILDTDEQVSFYATLMRVSKKKLRRLYTGCDERHFYQDVTTPKLARFTAVFRGKRNTEAGLPTILSAGRLLEKEGIDLRVYSPGYKSEDEVSPNVLIDQTFFTANELRGRMSECHISIGQMTSHERLDHSIPHKAFESFAMGIPYVSAESLALKEFLGKDKGLFVPAGDSVALASAIVQVRDENGFAEQLVNEGKRAYQEKASWEVLARALVGFMKEVRAK